MKYTKEFLEPLVKDSTSISQIVKKLGLKLSGGTQGNIKNRIKSHGINTSHFLGQAIRKGKQSEQKIHFSDILVCNRTGRKEPVHRLRKAMIESGVLHICSVCRCLPIWNDVTLVLQIDHKNGDNLDNTPSNVRFLCPNCHSQTENFGAKNRKIGRREQPYCSVCGQEVWKNGVTCRKCRKPQPTKIQWPLKDELLVMVEQLGVIEVGKKLGVSDTSVRKRLSGLVVKSVNALHSD